MTIISRLARLVAGVERGVDLSVNTLALGGMQLNGATSGTFTQLPNATTASYTVIWPAAQASGTQVLQNDGAGNLTWQTISSSAITALTGDVSATGPGSAAATVNSVGGSSAANIHSAELAANAATDADTNSTIVKRDSSGNFSATTITAALTGHASADLALTGGTMSGAINMGANKVTNLAPGTAGTDAINLNQLQNAMAGVQWRPEVNLYDNVDTTLPATTATLIDGVTVTDGMRVLFVNLASNNNEVYTAAVVSTAITWTAALDNDRVSAAPVTGDSILVLQGTTWSESAFNYNGTAWVQFNGANQVQAGTALSKTGNTLNVLVDGSTIDASGAGGSLEVKAAGIGTTQLAAASVTAAKLGSVTDGTTLDQSGAGSTIEIKASGVGTTQLASNAVTSAKIATSAFDGTTISGGGGSAATVLSAPTVQTTQTAGESFAANTTFAVRWAMSGETAGRVYKADEDATTLDHFWVIGMAFSAGGVSAGSTLNVISKGSYTLGSGDSAFSAGDIGKPVWLTAAGAFSTTAPTTANYACFKVGVVQSTTQLWVDGDMMGVN